MSVLGIFRLVAFIVATTFATIVVALAAAFIAITHNAGIDTSTYTFIFVGLTAGALTLLTLPAYLWIDHTRQGVFTSMIIVEMATLTIIWILWLVTASLSVSQVTLFNDLECLFGPSSFSDPFGNPFDNSPQVDLAVPCHATTAIEAFAFLSWFTLLGYAFVLLVFTFIASGRGHSVWTQSVKETNFFAPAVETAPQMQAQVMNPTLAPQFTGQPMYPPYQMGAPMPQQVPMFQGPPMQQMMPPFQAPAGAFMTPQPTGASFTHPPQPGQV